MGDDTNPVESMSQTDLIEGIATLARSYASLRQTDQDSKYDYSSVAEAIKRMAARVSPDK
jgi:hypothetical protein